MKGQNGLSRPSRGQAQRKPQLQDDSIMGTNNSSIVSKRSVERLYFPNEPHFFRYFVKRPQRRSPLINRGYWLRMRAVDRVVAEFLGQTSPKQKIVINLGCGYDPLPWQCLARYSAACENVVFIDVDYRDLMLKKREVVQNTSELNSVFTNIEVFEEGEILLRSNQYIQLGCDLRDLRRLTHALAATVAIEDCRVLFTAEVSITYMSVDAADDLVKWAGTLPEAQFCLLEQLLPDGIDHPFARTMMSHFEKLQTPLGAVQKYPSTALQEQRFVSLGWLKASARNLWELWGASDFTTSIERMSLDIVEPFDEWEEFALFGCHYFLLVADNVNMPHLNPSSSELRTLRTSAQLSSSPEPLQVQMDYSENPKLLGCRRFAAAMPVRSSQKISERIGNFGGMGLQSRMGSFDVYTSEELGEVLLNSEYPPLGPSSRMCHTITDMGDTGALLVGGRTSPDGALADCWLYHKWLNTWERVDDLPRPKYRHSAVNLGYGCVLIGTGRGNSRTLDDEYLIWSRPLGWVACGRGVGEWPLATHGATFTVFGSQNTLDKSSPRFGLQAGGLSGDAILQQDIWTWEVENFCDEKPTLNFAKYGRGSCAYTNQHTLARFGATTVIHQGRNYILGGIVKDEILKACNDICMFVNIDSAVRPVYTIAINYPTPRPLLIGPSIMSTGDLLLVMGGSAVCFSFGTFWNKGCYTLHISDQTVDGALRQAEQSNFQWESWKYLHTVPAGTRTEAPKRLSTPESACQNVASVPRLRIKSSTEFHEILKAGKPVILEGLDLGPCTELWTTCYLNERIGAERKVIVHEATSEHMDFKAKNFTYVTKLFGEFVEEIQNGGRLYLRSLSSDNPSELPADLTRDFPSIAADFRLPPELAFVLENSHSSPLRISGPVIMWLHYDVMANVLCQIQGSKELLLFPPSDIRHLDFEPGGSSSSVNVFNKLQNASLTNCHPHNALLRPGDILFLPPMWLHTASPTSGVSIAVNLFFRSLQVGYAAGKDVYGNRDLQAYEKGRRDIAKIINSFDSLPTDIRGFYLQRLVNEFEQRIS